jgi:TonB-dependent SusC/RagA subfamily outer membrane receptor
MKKLIIAFLLLSVCFCIQAQNLVKSRKTSHYTYIYKITDKEAYKLYKRKKLRIDETNLHTLLDSFPTDSDYQKKLSKGHYVKVYADKNQLNFSITTVYPFEIHVLDNNTDLCVQLYDTIGNIINNAKVKAKGKKLHYDESLKAFIDKKSNKKGLLKINYTNETFFFDLERDANNPFVKRVTNNVLYTKPVKYVWVPIKFICRLPVDATKSIVNRNQTGVISSSIYFFKNLYNKVACIFDDYHCDDSQFENKHKGYLVFNKPRYLPKDTVKFKAFITNKKGRPVKKDVEVVFRNGNYKNFKLTKLQPYRKGAFEYQFYLHDSLELRLDTRCNVQLRKKGWKTYISNSFQYEDYELSDVHLSIRMPSDNQYKGTPFSIFLSGKDENDLNLLDGRYKLVIKPIYVKQYFDDQVFVPDTLFTKSGNLLVDKETEIAIPDSVFPAVNMEYELEVSLLSADNDVDVKTESVNYFSKLEEIKLELSKDSMLFHYLENGNEKEVSAKIYGIDNFENYTDLKVSKLPFKTKISPYFRWFEVNTNQVEDEFSLEDEDALIQCFTERTHDSVFIHIENPRKLSFNYFIYKLNHEITNGYGTELSWKRKDLSKKKYYISLQYLWGGQMQNRIYEIPYTKNRLNIDVEQPNMVYPGQKAKINLKITDQKGLPVSNVDVTAFSLTKKFNYTVASLPEFEKYRKQKTRINSFNLADFNKEKTFRKPIEYYKYKKRLGLDSIEFYSFLYPGKELFQYADSVAGNQTQFSPYVINNGKIETIHVIYLDWLPVYFSWSNNDPPYSFSTTEGYHNIRIRTSTKEFFIDSVYFTGNKKNILSFSDSLNIPNIRIEDRKPMLSEGEKGNLYRYIFPYHGNFNLNMAYLEQKDHVIRLSKKRNYGTGIVGPVLPQPIDFNLVGNYSTRFTHEPFFEYDFSPGLLKMRSYEKENYPMYLTGKAIERLNDSLLSKKQLLTEWSDYLEMTRYNHARVKSTYVSGQEGARIIIDYEPVGFEQPIYILLRNYNENEYFRLKSNRMYPFFHTQKENYQLVLIFKNNRYSLIDSLSVLPGGINYFRYTHSLKKQHGIFNTDSSSLNYYENQLITKSNQAVGENRTKRKSNYKLEYDIKNKSNWRMISGTIVDVDQQEPIPGVNVLVKGTTIGTISDFEGNYTILVPDNASELVFSYIGYEATEKHINNNTINVTLNSSNVGIDEVVVIGYGTVKKTSLTESVSNRVSYRLMGQTAGVSITNAGGPGSTEVITIRGANSLGNSAQPLYVIDGMVYSGADLNLTKAQIEKMEVLKGSSATTIYGSRGANGVVLITTKSGYLQTKKKGTDFDDEFYQTSLKSSSLRSNFSDYAFWQPKLKTDKNGEVSFEVTYPDDITGWKTYFLAMNNNKKTGQTETFVKSYKPLMAQLSVPRFLLQGDRAGIIGKVKNYTSDSVFVNTKLTVKDSAIFQNKQLCKDILIDTVFVEAKTTDSLNISYLTEKGDGYFDGEKRSIPVFKQGLKETKGQFFVLDKDTSLELSFDTTIQNVTIHARADVLDVVNEEIEYLINYKYDCNEQLASKLIALLAHKKVREFKNKKFQYEKQIKAIIKKLRKNQQNNGFWGWWGTAGKSHWISNHVVKALKLADKAGYKTDVEEQFLVENLVWQVEHETDCRNKIRLLELLKQYNAGIDYAKYLDKIEGPCTTFYDSLKIVKLQQECVLKYDTRLILSNLDTTLFGNIFLPNKRDDGKFYENDIQASLLAYQVLKNDSLNHQEILLKMRNYFFEKRKGGYWQNTFESAQIIDNILPDILDSSNVVKESKIDLSGAINKDIEKFPYTAQLNASDKIFVKKTGAFPVYLTAYQQYWNQVPKEKSDDFMIDTKFVGQDSSGVLKSGEKYTLQATVLIKRTPNM